MKYAHIVIPMDFSEHSEKALEYGLAFAKEHQSRVTLLHVATLLQAHLEREFPVYDYARFDAVQKEQIQEQLDPFVEKARSHGLEAEARIISGYAEADQILDFIEEHQPDLVIMGTHGRTGLTHLLMGSIAEKVVRMSRVPVLTVHRDWEEATRS